MKIITIGDLHGKSNWVTIDHKKYDKIIFIGDYVDSFEASDETIIMNLLSIIQFKKDNMDKVILLWGNHDIQYLFNHPMYRCSGYRKSYAYYINRIFNDNYNLFQFSFQIEKYLWSHAGVHKGWFIDRMIPVMKELLIDQYSLMRESDGKYKFKNLSEELNFLFSKQHEILFDVCKRRGGHMNSGGPLWLDKTHSEKKPLQNFHQIVGHSKVDKIVTFNKKKSTSITFVDCLDKGHEFYTLEI